MRRAIEAPPGHKIVVGDLSQVEARVLAAWAECLPILRAFARDEDVYAMFATELYGYPVTDKGSTERFVGKTSILGLGYGQGKDRFFDGLRLIDKLRHLTTTELFKLASQAVETYRNAYPEITRLWRNCSNMLEHMIKPGVGYREIGPVKFGHEHILLPNGMRIWYRGLSCETGEYTYSYGRETRRLYGPKIVENVVQSLARIILFRAMLRLHRKYGYKPVLQVHDELVYVAPDAEAETYKARLLEELRAPVDFLPSAPLDAEVEVGDNYADAK